MRNRYHFHKIATVRLGRDTDGQVINLSGQLHGKFYQHLDARFVVHWLVGHFVPKATHPRSIPLSPKLLERFLRTAHSISMIRLSRIRK
jgi:hypothetical protein